MPKKKGVPRIKKKGVPRMKKKGVPRVAPKKTPFIPARGWYDGVNPWPVKDFRKNDDGTYDAEILAKANDRPSAKSKGLRKKNRMIA